MESATAIDFTTTAVSKVTIVQSTWSTNTIKLDDVELAVADAVEGTGCRVYTIADVAAGDHVISRGSGESGLFYVKVEWTTTKTVTFNNDANWANVNVYAWSGEGDNVQLFTAAWPGDALTPDATGRYTWSTDGEPTKIIFNDGTSQTPDLDFKDGGVYNSKERVITLQEFTATFKTDGMDEVYAYAWNDSEKPLGEWPGTKMEGGNGEFTIAIKAEDAPKYIIFHNNAGEQTSDLTFENGKVYEFMLNEYTVTFTTDAGWTDVYAWAWTETGEYKKNFSESWPGEKLEGTDGVYTYSVKSFEAPHNILFNNGSDEGKTADLAFTNGKAYKWITATPFYALKEGDTFKAGTTVDLGDATITYGVEGGADFGAAYAAVNEDYAGFAYMTGGNGENGGAETGTVYTIVPKYDGTITVGVRLNGGKSFFILEDGESMEGYNGITIKDAANTSYSFPVKANSTYKIYCTGSKLGFFGFDYKFTQPVAVEPIIPDGTYYVVSSLLGSVINAESALDYNGAPITFTFDAATNTYAITGNDFFNGKQWTIAEAVEGMSGYYTISTVIDNEEYFVNVESDVTVLEKEAGDAAIWILLQQAYWEDIVMSTYTVAGTKNLTGTENDWDIVEANQMTLNEETGLFEITYNNVTVSNEVKPEFKVVKKNMNDEETWYPASDESGDNNWVITPDYLGGEGEYDITITFDPSDLKEIGVTGLKIEDINITVEDGADIYEALIAAEMNVKPRNITINLVEGGNYTISGPLTAYANFEIQGNGATIDASGLSSNFIQMVTTDNPAVTVPVEYVSIHNATVKGLKKPLFYSAQKGYLINWLTIDNSIIEVAADATTIDFTKGSAARNFNIENSTIYAPVATTMSFYSSQAGQKLTELDEEGIQTFIVKNSTMYNLAKGKNFFTHRQNNQKWLAYNVENSIFVNCGKNGQTIKGLNGGGSSANPTWTITGNAFNFEADGVMTDTSAAEDTGDTTEGEGVQNSVAGVVTFTDAANGDFNGEFELGEGATAPEALGDGRWTIIFKGGTEVETTYYLVGTFNNWTASDTYKLTLNENADEGVVEYMLTLDIPANSQMKVLDNLGNWYPGDGRPNFEVNDEGNFTVYFRPNADGDEFWFEGCIYCQYNGEPVGINGIYAEKLNNATIYNLNGQRVQNAQKGLYIVNGRKVVIK